MTNRFLLVPILCVICVGSRCNDKPDSDAEKQAPSGESKDQASKPEGPPSKDQKDSEDKKQQEPTFEVSVDENYYRPGFRRTPPADSNGDKPVDVVKRFLESTSKADFATARKCVRLNTDRPLLPSEVGRPVPSVGEELFPVFCEKMRNHIKSVTLSGSTIKGKGGSWFVRYKLENTAGRKLEGRFCAFYLSVDKGQWKIRENLHWIKIAKGEYSEKDRNGEPLLLAW